MKRQRTASSGSFPKFVSPFKREGNKPGFTTPVRTEGKRLKSDDDPVTSSCVHSKVKQTSENTEPNIIPSSSEQKTPVVTPRSRERSTSSLKQPPTSSIHPALSPSSNQLPTSAVLPLPTPSSSQSHTPSATQLRTPSGKDAAHSSSEPLHNVDTPTRPLRSRGGRTFQSPLTGGRTFQSPLNGGASNSRSFVKLEQLKKRVAEKRSLLRKFRHLARSRESGEEGRMKEEVKKWRGVSQEVLERLLVRFRAQEPSTSMEQLIDKLGVSDRLIGFDREDGWFKDP